MPRRASGDLQGGTEIPRILSRPVSRPAVLKRLDRMAPIALLEGLSGQGKTTVVAQWAQAQRDAGAVVVWLQAQSTTDDEDVVLRAVHRSLRMVGAGSLLPEPVSADGLHSALRDALDALAPRRVILVVDDAHRLTSPRLADGLVGLTRECVNLHLVVCGTTARAFREAAGGHRLEVTALTGADLLVAVDELAQFADAWGHDLSEEDARELHDLVGGWLLPARLVLDATSPAATQLATHLARDFLEQRIVPRIGEHPVLAAGPQLALADTLTKDAADVLLRARPLRSAEALTTDQVMGELERQGLAQHVPRRGQGDEWRLPALVRHLLAERFEREHPDVARSCHRALVRADAGRGRPGSIVSAMRHARLGRDWPMLVELWAEGSWQLALASPEEFIAAYARLPAAALDQHPALRLPRSLAAGVASTEDLNRGLHTLRRRYLQAGADSLRRIESIAEPTERYGVLSASIAFLCSEGRLEEAERLVQQLCEDVSRPGPDLTEEVALSLASWSHFQAGVVRYLEGDLAGSVELMTTAFETRPAGVVAPQAAAFSAMSYAFMGRPEECRRWLTACESATGAAPWTRALTAAPAGVARAMLAMDRLDADAVERELRDLGSGLDPGELWTSVACVRTRHALLFGSPVKVLAELDLMSSMHASQLHNSSDRTVMDRCRAELLLSLGEVNRVKSIVPDALAVPAPLTTATARLYLMTGDHAKAARVAAAGAWSPEGLLRDRIDQLMLKAAALLAQQLDQEAVRAFQHGHTLAQQVESLTPYVLLPVPVRDRLLALAGVTLDAEAQSRVAQVRTPYPERATMIELSPREAEVLRLMRCHETAAAIARTLSVSVNTVRKQIVSVYAKLGVHDRTSALLRAERLALVNKAHER